MKVVIFGSDRYLGALIPTFAHFYNKFWPDRPWPTVVVSQTLVVEEFPTMLTGPDEAFSQQVLRFLEEHGRDEPFLMLLEDYFLSRPVDTEALAHCHEIMLADSSVVHINIKVIDGVEVARDYDNWLQELDKGKSDWLFQNQAGIWRPRVLRDLCRPEEDGWRMETRGSRRAKRYPGLFLALRESAMEYVNYMSRGGPRKEGLEWLKVNGMEPIYLERG